MSSLLIYSGLSSLLLGAILGLIAAIKGFALNNYKIELITKPNPIIKKNTKPALLFFIIGAILLAIGISIGLTT